MHSGSARRLLPLVLVAAGLAGQHVAARTIRVGLAAPWPTTPLSPVLEVACTIAQALDPLCPFASAMRARGGDLHIVLASGFPPPLPLCSGAAAGGRVHV